MVKIAILTTDNREHYKNYGFETPQFGTAPQALMEGLSAAEEIEFHIVTCAREPVRSPDKLAKNIFFHSLIVPKWGWLSTGYLGCIRAVRRKLKQIQPDLIHGQGTERDCAMSAVFSGFPNILTLHGNMVDVAQVLKSPPFSYHWLTAKLESLALRRTLGVLCNSAYTEMLVRPRAKKTWRVPNAVRKKLFDQPSQPPNREKCVILNVGVVCEYKQQLKLLELARRLHGRRLPIQLLFLGSVSPGTPYGRAFLESMKQAEADGYASYAGFKTLNELIKLYDESAALIHTSTSESFGLVVAEALARNLKFFGMRVGGVPDIAESVEGAELCENGDWTGLENAIATWLQAGWSRPKSAADTMAARYHPDIVARRHVEIYYEILRPKRKFES